jgi:hypothetical protein
VTGRTRTCNAPRFRRALFRLELRSRETLVDRPRPRSGLQGSSRDPGSAPADPGSCASKDGQGWARTSGLPFVRRALSLLSYSPKQTPGQGVEPRSPRSERGVLPVRRSRNGGVPDATPSSPHGLDATATAETAGLPPMSRPDAAAERCFLCLSPTLRPWITVGACAFCRRRRPTWRGFGA